MNKFLAISTASAVLALSFSGVASSATIAEVVAKTLKTNPDIMLDANRRLAADEGVKKAKGGYYPKVNLNLGYGHEWSENISTRNNNATATGTASLWRHEAGLTLSQLVYDGSATTSEINRQKSILESASNRVMGTSEQISLKAIETYLDVLRRGELLKLAQDNLAMHDKTFSQIKIRSEGGIGRKADLEQAQARLSLTQANVASAEANLREANIAFNQVVGEMPDALVKPGVIEPPASVDDALKVALSNNPILRSAIADIKAAEAQKDAADSLLKPRVNMELGTDWNQNISGIEYKNNDAYAMVRMRYNLFNGGSDMAGIAQATIQIQEANDVLHRTERQVEDSLRLSWNAWLTAQDRLPKLASTVDAAERTRDAYIKQFNIGQRTLLDLLDSENELFTDRANYVEAQYIDIFSRYRLMADTGHLLDSLGVAPREEAKLAQ